ncbi:hypothetical protein [Flavobacterium sp.]|uniref:hypothetical protein n=1 Tax=Flavobacterium sp. TaxID=239 RepID=UPI0012204E2C|nr:hypothetical protein [Flavobacterium sp.]RZJ72039.1 MAG: hypothetical protein EOO49_08410 [Flavobacterium sp.]
MRIVLFSIGFALSATFASAQEKIQPKSTFIAPELTFSRELFPTQKDSISFLSLAPANLKSTLLVNSADNKLPANYDWQKDVNRSNAIKRSAVRQYTSDPLGRSPLPDASRDVMERSLIRDMKTN